MIASGFGDWITQAKIQRKAVNPFDKSTIVTAYPKPFSEFFPTLLPGRFDVPGAPKNGYALKVITPASTFRLLDDDENYIEVPVNSYELAQSIVQKYAQGLWECNMGDKKPAIFAVPGEYDELSIESYKDENGRSFTEILADALKRQENWYRQMIVMADSLWARTNGNPLAIAGDARLAAEMLQLDKPWMKDQRIYEMVNCPGCGSLLNPEVAICATCRVIVNKELFKARGLEFANL